MKKKIVVTKNDEYTVKVEPELINCYERRCSSCGTRNNVSWMFYRYEGNNRCIRYAICPSCASTIDQAITLFPTVLVKQEISA